MFFFKDQINLYLNFELTNKITEKKTKIFNNLLAK